MKTSYKVLTSIAIVISAAFVLFNAYYSDIYNVFAAIDIVVWVCLGIDVLIFVWCIFRLLSTMNDPERFRADVLVPGVAALLCGCLAFAISPAAENSVIQKQYKENKQLYGQAVEYLQSTDYSDVIALPDKYAVLSRNGKVLAFNCDNGAHICYMFVKTETQNRTEGVLYLDGSTAVVYYDITDRYLNYEFTDLGGGFVYMVLYK